MTNMINWTFSTTKKELNSLYKLIGALGSGEFERVWFILESRVIYVTVDQVKYPYGCIEERLVEYIKEMARKNEVLGIGVSRGVLNAR